MNNTSIPQINQQLSGSPFSVVGNSAGPAFLREQKAGPQQSQNEKILLRGNIAIDTETGEYWDVPFWMRGLYDGCSLSTAHNRPRDKKLTLKQESRPRAVYRENASLLKATKDGDCPQVGGGKRNGIKGFSRQSRRRLLNTIGSVRRDADLPYFITLTYPDRFPTVERSKRDLKVFLQRFEREFPNSGLIWKLEPQERGAPHFHMLAWRVGNILGWVIKNWYEIAGDGDKNHFLFHAGLLRGSKPCVQKVKSFKGVWSYASKYIGKTFEVAEWGSQWTGRFWGVLNRGNIPFGKEVEIDLEIRQVFQLMRFQRRFAKIKKGNGNSLTIFCDADQWINNIYKGLLGNEKFTGYDTSRFRKSGAGVCAGIGSSG